MKLRRVCCAIAGSVLLGAAPWVAAGEPQPVSAELVTDAARLAPGSTVSLGVRLEIAPGWHVYWRNPGNAGLATAVDVDLPDGLGVGPLQWPVPTEFDQPGGIVGYGYEGEVVLWRPLEVATEAPPAEAAGVVHASWLACRERCLLGGAELPVRLPAARAAAERGRETLTRWRGRLPKPAADGPAATVRGGLGDAQRPGTVTVWLQWARAPGQVSWFPAPSEALEVRDVEVRTRGDRTRIDFTASARAGQSRPEAVLASVVAVGSGEERTGFQLPVPLSAAGR